MTNSIPFDPYALLEALDRNRVSHVVIGGFARVVHGSGELTRGLDIAPSLREETCAASRAQRTSSSQTGAARSRLTCSAPANERE